MALNGRQTFIVFDSDVMLKPAVASALKRLGEFLKARGTSVAYIYLLSGPSAEKTGVDDYLALEHSVDEWLALAVPEVRALPMARRTNHKAEGRPIGSSPSAAARSSSTTRKARLTPPLRSMGTARSGPSTQSDSRDGCDMPPSPRTVSTRHRRRRRLTRRARGHGGLRGQRECVRNAHRPS